MTGFKLNLKRNEKRLISKIKSPSIYKIIIWFVFLMFPFKKMYFSFSNKNKSNWLVSITSDKILWKKISYIDDLVVHKKSRWKGIWKILLWKVLQKAEKEDKSDYTFLLTKKNRRESHWLYKKFWFTLIWFWIWYLAYKSNKKIKK